MADDSRKKHISESAREIFASFLADSMNYLRPDGGKRTLLIEVEVTDPDHTGYGNETAITMTEDLGHDRKTQVFAAKFRER